MKQVIAVIRDEAVEKTKYALAAAGIKRVTYLHVTGRGQQKDTIRVPGPEGTAQRNLGIHPLHKRCPVSGLDKPEEKEYELGFIPQRMLMIAAADEDVRSIVQLLINANQSGRHGDGKIFICPVVSVISVRTEEPGNLASS